MSFDLNLLKRVKLPYSVLKQINGNINEVNPFRKVFYENVNNNEPKNWGSLYEILKSAYYHFFNETKNSNISSTTIKINPENDSLLPFSFSEILAAKVSTTQYDEEITPIAIIDFENSTKNKNRIIDGNITNIVSNRRITNINNTPIAALDLGEPKNVGVMNIYWIDETRLPNLFKIQSSNDGLTWKDETNGISPIYSSDNLYSYQSVMLNDASGRYFRIYIISTTNIKQSWRLSEIKLYSSNNYNIVKDLSQIEEVSLTETENGILLTNKSSKPYNISFKHTIQ